MNSGPASWLPMALVAGLAAMTFWLGQLGQGLMPKGAGVVGHEPDYIVEVFTATAFDERGHPRHELAAPRLVHYMDDDSTHVEAPVYRQREVGRPAVSVVAKRAVVTAKGDEVHFHDKVRMTREAVGDQPAMTLDTEFLQVIPDAQRMQTDRTVTVHQAKSNITAGAMVADGKANTLVFSQRVRSSYEKP